MQTQVTDGSEHRDYAAAQEIMACELSFGPERSTELIVQTIDSRKSLRRNRLLVIAASVLVTILASSFFVPFLSFALARLPLVGTPYQHMLISTRLDTAYRAGLVRELNRSATSNGFTLTVKSAYSDPRVSIVIVKLTSDDQEALKQLGTQGNWPQVKLHGAFGWESHCYVTAYTYDENEGALYGWLRTASTPWWAGGSWVVEAKGVAAASLRVRVPVHRILGEFMAPQVKLNQTVAYKDLQVRLRNIVFYPTTTVLNYGEISKISEYHESSHVPKWELISGGRVWEDETGYESDPKETTFYPIYYPSIPDDLVLRLKGYELSHLGISIPAIQGSEDGSLGTSILVKEIADTEDGLKVVFESSDPNYLVTSVWFRRENGKGVAFPHVHTSHGAPGETTKLFPLSSADIKGCQMDVFVTQFIEVEEDISINIGELVGK